MRSLKSSLAAQIGAMFLFVISLMVLAVSCVGIFFMVYENVYFDEGIAAREEIVTNYLQGEMLVIADHYENELNLEYIEKNLVDENFEFQELLEVYDKKETNVAFSIADEKGKEIVSNYHLYSPEYECIDEYTVLADKRYENETRSFETYNERWAYIEECEDKYFDVYYDAYDQNTDADETYECILNISYVTGDPVDITITACLADELVVKDELYFTLAWFDKLVDLRYTIIAIAVMAFVIFMFSFIFLFCAAGHKAGVEGIHLNWADRIPLDLYWGALFFLAVLMIRSVDSIGYWRMELISIALFAVAVFVLIILAMAALLSFATRAKAGKWWQNTIIYKVFKLIFKVAKMVFTAIPVIPKVMVGLAALCLANLVIAFLYPEDGSVLFWFVECVLLVPMVVLVVLQLRKLRKGVENIACGDFKSQVDTSKLMPELRACGESINSINNVLSREVNERMKSERFKTELITNVSHDIKTPLTSIINYVDIIKKKDIADEELRSYIEVLDRQSGRLKKLIEDLVECSKAQTGNIAVNKTSLDIGVLLTQTVGEYQEKLEANELSLVVEQPEESLYVSADGRLLWRAVDNLLNNACKYSLPGTRVYLKLEEIGDEAVVTLKNVSKDQLNMTSEELMERFVRGDSSRNTEGSGLGLSIAQSLIELQQAKMELKIDGDLFKVVIRFKKIGGEFVGADKQ